MAADPHITTTGQIGDGHEAAPSTMSSPTPGPATSTTLATIDADLARFRCSSTPAEKGTLLDARFGADPALVGAVHLPGYGALRIARAA